MTDIDATGPAGPNSSRHLLSILIPTCNRQRFAAAAARCALAIPSSDLEVVVQDCSNDDSLSSMLIPELADKRLVYRYERPAFMAENWNRAIGHARGEYICLIGDDDGVIPEILDAAAWAKREDLDCLAVKNTVDYRWPGATAPATLVSRLFKRALDGYLQVIHPFRDRITMNVDTEKELRKLVRDGGVYYLEFDLPKLYHGLVHRRCLEKVRDRIGTFTGGMSPEMYVSLAMACTAPRLAVIDYPLTIPGACRASNTIIQGVLKCQSQKLEDQPEFRARQYRWADVIPRLYTVPPIWADSAVASLLAMGRADLVQQLNLPRLAAHCVRANQGVTEPVLQGLLVGLETTGKSFAIGKIMFAWNVMKMAVAEQVGRVKRLLIMLASGRSNRIEGLSDIVEASKALTRYLADNSWSFARCASKPYRCK